MDNLREALSRISVKTDVVAVSSVYETEPMYREDQRKFLNCVVAVQTDLAPQGLLEFLKRTEREMGRTGRERNAPRIIDMDILFYGDLAVSGASLEVPHPRIAERAFVLVPLNEIRPGLVHPVSNKTVRAMLKALGSTEGVFKTSFSLAGPSPARPRRPGRPGGSPSRRAFARGSRR